MPDFWMLSDRNLEVRFEAQSGTLSVTDKRCRKVWRQLPVGDGFVVGDVSQEGNVLVMEFVGAFALTLTLELSADSELVFSLSAPDRTPLEKLRFPPAFQTPDPGHYVLQTDGAGILLPADDAVYPLGESPFFFCGGGAAMAWIGVTDATLETGYMAIVETPFDAAIETKRVDGLITFSPVWLGSMGEFGYVRRVRYVFFDQGGYVAQCKRYRRYVWPKNAVVSLRENQRRFPAIEKILGAVHIYVWDEAREVEFARRLKAAGIEKALIVWNANHLPYPEPGYDLRLKELGYATGGYELFSDIHPDAHPAYARLAGIPLRRNLFPGLFTQLAAVTKEGGHYSNQFGTYVCPAAVRPEMIKRVEKELRDYPHDNYFLDVYQANGLYECYHPEHRLTREQYAGAMLENMRLLEDRYGTFIGGEWGADFAGSHGVYVHGMMTLQRLWFGSEISEEGTIYYYGNWKSNPRPSIMLGSRVAPESYLRYGINEALRVPLYELVYHDAVVTSWRWEDCNHHTPEIWWKKDLFNILYGTAPLWSIDQERWAAYEASFVRSYRNVCPWLQEICYEEMISHRFVTPDRTVQETRFASGKRAVVNFGEAAYAHEGRTVPARGFITFRE